MNEQPKNSSIYSSVPLTTDLRDVRSGRWGQKFGTVEAICKQYGIKCIKHPKYTEFTAPKIRLQLFLEKLHFSKTHYSKIPW